MTDLSYLRAVRESYDTVAGAYLEQVRRPGQLDPLSRAMLAAFAETVRTAGLGAVGDLGCGPGPVTAHLAGLGVDAFGVDLSPEMIGLARRTHPGLGFAVGSMTALPLADDALGGILAHYSVHHTPPALLPVVFGEFHRALAPGGTVVVAGHVAAGEELRLRPAQAYGGLPVTYASYVLPPDRLAELLGRAGLVVTARLVQEPADGAVRTVATLLAHKPGRP
ncbi:class I SAM-dependent methyltransferase [Streptomyces sp. NBC_01497]|uniref:class I SAM-dependent methyltransferase n=1 Tax=Streptomyces sp. NBC_01497 TaxID=2903885 RepID=UPI002E342857|nr:class I SAM-dependent methyltransferase [Streptomyces sp. NBC_01497]